MDLGDPSPASAVDVEHPRCSGETIVSERRDERFGALRRILPFVVIVAASAHGAWMGWGRWGDFVVDTGRELEWPRRILEGERLYSDLRYFYGPLAPHLNALLYRIFGVRLEVLAWAGALTGTAAALATYAIARRFVDRFGATLAALSFVYACAFQHLGIVGIFNFVLPYTFAATYGMLAALLSLWTLLRYLERERERTAWFVASAIFLALAALAKVETFVPALTVHVLFLLWSFVSRRVPWVPSLCLAAAAAIVLGVYGAFYLEAGPALLRDNLGGALNPGSQHFVAAVMGLGSPAPALRALGISAVLLGGSALIAFRAAAVARAPRLPAAARWGVIALAAAAVGAPAAMINPDRVFRALPFLTLAAACVALWRWWTAPELRRRVMPHLLLAAFACTAALRIFFAATPAHYGFYMLAPSVAWLVVLLLEYLPRSAPALPWTRLAFSACAAALLVGNASAAIRVTEGFVGRKTFPLRSKRGTLWVEPVQVGAVPILNALARSPRNTRVLVIPHAMVINFITGRAGALDGMPSYLPMEFFGGYDDAHVIARWERNPPDLVLWGRGPVAEFGDEEFGKTYAVEALRWILAHYEPVNDPDSQALLMRWRGKPAAP